MKTVWIILAICVACLKLPYAMAMENTKGTIYYPEDSNLTPFSYQYEKTVTGAKAVGKTKYLDEKGKVLVDEETHYEDGKFRLFRQQLFQTDEGGTIEIQGNKIVYDFRAGKKHFKEESEIEERLMVPDMVVDTYRESWNELMKDESVFVRFLLLERQESIGFKFFKERELEYSGKPAVELILKPSSFIIAALAPKIRLIVEKNAPHRLLEMRGRLPVRVPKVNPPTKRGDWRAIDARLVLEYK